jgi:chromosome segregation ATPase
MNVFRLWSAFLLCSMMALQGCGNNQQAEMAAKEGRNRQVVSQLQSKLGQARTDLDAHKARNAELNAEVQRLSSEVQDLEGKIAKAAAAPVVVETPAPPPAQDVNPEGRVELMGAKALAEFRAQQLHQRVDKLNKDLQSKEKELAAIREQAQQKEAEVAKLSATIEQFRTEEQQRSQDVNARLEELGKQLAARSEESIRLKKDLDDKADLLAALKQSVGDCAKVRTHAETESGRLQAQLNEETARLRNTEQQLAQTKQENEKSQNHIAELRRHLEQLSQAAQQVKQQAEISAQEARTLKAELARVQPQTSAKQAAQAPQPAPPERQVQPAQTAQMSGGDEPTNVEEILAGTPRQSSAPMEWLY